ncbi:hypothetical protein BDZ85DRAFT_305220 [Elsinoe ampelina]|uniref:Uncharacterized protein n=1 Tax=Elsinoe ampelina TaxID=302913 RepID=A0A6A6GKT5_9PEZI|nr:hypothetical protein BDZ85DRAFT_305220 [Elsinoe ampelina]
MSSKDNHLYHVPHSKKQKTTHDTSSSLAFTSQLSSLISTAKTSSRPTTGRSHKKKDDIFASHNRNSAKRAKKDLENNGALTTRQDSEAVDSAAWARSKRKMEEKARLYAAMKRGDVEDDDGKLMVDFDSKWAAEQEKNGDNRWDNESSEGSEEDDEVIEWEDEFGRTRKGKKSEMMKQQRRKALEAEIAERKRPVAPDKVIWGDTVQADAFNPDRDIQDKMDELARKRDKSLTPPPDEHFDSNKEVRSKGVGFMQFSMDAEERKKQMEGLEKEREETERKRMERDEVMDERRRKLEERKRLIEEKRAE